MTAEEAKQRAREALRYFDEDRGAWYNDADNIPRLNSVAAALQSAAMDGTRALTDTAAEILHHERNASHSDLDARYDAVAQEKRAELAEKVVAAARHWRVAWQAVCDGRIKAPKGKAFEDMMANYRLSEALEEYETAALSSTPAQRDRTLEAMAILSAFIELSDRVKTAASPLDAQGKLLAMQNSIQKNRPRIVKWCDDVRAEYGA